MKQFSNLYIFCFSSALVLLVAVALSFTALSLEDKQNENIEIERKQNILTALGVKTAKSDVLTEFDRYIDKGEVYKANGKKADGVLPENLVPKKVKETIDGKKKTYTIWVLPKTDERLLPVYFAKEDGKIIIPVRGSGLWGPIWGNVALGSDMNTVSGVTFDHAGETPGLGAEINTEKFQAPFKNKKLFDSSNRFVSIKVEKPGTYTSDSHTVDAISGGTITSKALEAMIRDSLEPYKTYFSQSKSN